MQKRKSLILWITICLLASSCKNPDLLGLDIADKDKINGELEMLPLVSYTVREDSLLSSNLAKNLLGYVNEGGTFGSTKAEIAAQLLLQQTNTSFGASSILDSAILILSYAGSYGPNTEAITINVHQLDQDIFNDSIYYSARKIQYKTDIIGSKTFIPKPKDSVTVMDIRSGKSDTLVTLAPQLRIKLDSTFISTNFLKGDVANFASPEAFLTYFKGIYLSVDSTKLPAEGGIMYFDLLNTGKSKLTIYYKATDSSSTQVVNFNINSASAVVNRYQHNYTGTEVAAQLADTSGGMQQTYIQAASGLRTQLRINGLAELRAKGKIAINKAQLELLVPVGTNDIFEEPARLFIVIKDEQGRYVNIPDWDLGDFHYKGTFDEATQKYTFNISSYLQGLLDGKYIDRGIYLIASGAPYSANRVILGGPSNSSYPMKLSVYYTKLD